MGVFSALTTGASGLTAFGEAVRVVGDNIANVNTLGFKAQSINFSDVLGQTVNVSRSNIANQVGNGVRIGSITRNQSQGAVEGTTNATDMAISGNGLFVLKDQATQDQQYSRAGNFFLDKNSNLINGQSLQLQGFALDSNGNAVGNITGISVANIAATAQASTKVTAGINLNSSSTAIDPAKILFDPTVPASFSFKSDVNVFDSLGAKHNVSLYFSKVGADSSSNAVWDWRTVVDGGDVTGGTKGTAVEISPTVYNVANKTLLATGIIAGSIISPDAVSSGAVTFGQGTVIADETGKTATISSTAVARNNGIWDPAKFTDFKTYASTSRGTSPGTGAFTAGTNTSITGITQTSNPNGANDTYTLVLNAAGTQIVNVNATTAGTDLLATANGGGGPVTLTTGAGANVATLTLGNGVVLSANFTGTAVANTGGGNIVVSGANAGGTASDGLGLSSTGPYRIVSVGGTATGTATMTAGNISTKPSSVASSVATGGAQSLIFNQSTGALKTAAVPSISFPWASASASSLAFNFGSPTDSGGTGTDGTLQLAGASAPRSLSSDGFASGFLDRLETDSSGKINGVFTNGQRRGLFQVALAKFPNEAVLNKLGDNMLAETIASGTPIIGKPNNGGLGNIQPFALEKSNVDLANEFVKLIVIQRAYEANSKTILTTDQMLSALMTLKR